MSICEWMCGNARCVVDMEVVRGVRKEEVGMIR